MSSKSGMMDIADLTPAQAKALAAEQKRKQCMCCLLIGVVAALACYLLDVGAAPLKLKIGGAYAREVHSAVVGVVVALSACYLCKAVSKYL